jgi:hypothetical protein
MPDEQRQYSILINDGSERRKFAWLTFTDIDGKVSISIGFADRAFFVPGFVSHVPLPDGSYRLDLVDLRSAHRPAALTNPHFTFHPPAALHLRAPAERFILDQFVMMDLQVADSGRVPCLSLRSARIDKLPIHQSSRPGTEIISIEPETVSVSVALEVDFIDGPARGAERSGGLLTRVFEWRGWTLQLVADAIAPLESATFTAHWEG